MAIVDTEVATSGHSSWRFRIGMGFVGLAIFLWLLIPLAVALDAPAARVAALTGTVFIANKVLLLACIAVMGKEGFQQLKALIFGQTARLRPAPKVGPARHAVGMVMFFLPIVSSMLEPYFDMMWPGLRPNLWQVQLAGDLMWIASFIVLGGEFWSKARLLFVRG